MRVDLPTPHPAKMPKRCPAQIAARLGILSGMNFAYGNLGVLWRYFWKERFRFRSLEVPLLCGLWSLLEHQESHLLEIVSLYLRKKHR